MSESNTHQQATRFTCRKKSKQEEDLDELIISLLKSKYYYSAMAIITDLSELKKKYTRLAAERKYYVYLLYQNLGEHSRTSVDEKGNLVNTAIPTFIQAMEIYIGSEKDMLHYAIKNEQETVAKYDTYLRNHIPLVAHLKLVADQKLDVRQTIQSLL